MKGNTNGLECSVCCRRRDFGLVRRTERGLPCAPGQSRNQGDTLETYYQTTAALADIAAIIGSDEQVARVVRIGWVTPEKLTEDELTQYGYLMASFLRRYENVFFQYESGLVDAGFWDGHRENLLWAFRRPGMQLIWKDRKQSFSVGFREFLDRSDAIELATPDSRRL